MAEKTADLVAESVHGRKSHQFQNTTMAHHHRLALYLKSAQKSAHVRRALREEFYRAYITRASSGEGDNTPLIERTLALRREQAHLLGYPNYAEVSLASKVAPPAAFS